MRSLNEAINNGAKAWATEFAEANGLADIDMCWGVLPGRWCGARHETRVRRLLLQRRSPDGRWRLI